MYSLNYKVTTSTCDSEGRLKLYSALQMMQDCSEMWIDTEPVVKQYFAEQNMAQLLAFRQVEIIRVPVYKEELTVTTRRPGMSRVAGAENGMRINRAELFKAACCNLGESFTTNPSVDVNYSDAATGAKQIRLLGLSGTYVQMLTENLPN